MSKGKLNLDEQYCDMKRNSSSRILIVEEMCVVEVV